MTQKKLNLSKMMIDAVGEDAVKTWDNFDLLEVFAKQITKEQLNDDNLIFEDPDAKNGLFIIFAYMMLLKEGVKPDKALRRLRSKNLTNSNEFHSTILSFLEAEKFEYDDDIILDLCLKYLK